MKRAISAVESPGTPDEEVLWCVFWDPEEQWAYRRNDRGQRQWAAKLLVRDGLDAEVSAVFDNGVELWVEGLDVLDWLADGDTATVKKKIQAWLGSARGSGLVASHQQKLVVNYCSANPSSSAGPSGPAAADAEPADKVCWGCCRRLNLPCRRCDGTAIVDGMIGRGGRRARSRCDQFVAL